MKDQTADPASRVAQKNLAFEVTALVHGEDEAQKVAQASEDLFSGAASDNAPVFEIEPDSSSLVH